MSILDSVIANATEKDVLYTFRNMSEEPFKFKNRYILAGDEYLVTEEDYLYITENFGDQVLIDIFPQEL